MSILKGLQNKPFQTYNETTLINGTHQNDIEINENETKLKYSKDDSFNYFMNMKFEIYFSKDHQIVKVLINKFKTLIITKKQDTKPKHPPSSTFDIISIENSYLSDGKIKHRFLNKVTIEVTDDFRIREGKEEEEKFSFIHICQKFVVINTEYKIVIVDYINNLYSTIFTKNIDRTFDIFYNYDEMIMVKGKVLNRSYIFGYDKEMKIYFFKIDDDSFEKDNDLDKVNIVMKKLKFDYSSDIITDLKVIKMIDPKEKKWFYIICYLKEREFIYYISEYVKCSFNSIVEKIHFNSPIIQKSSFEIKGSKYKMKKIYEFLNQNEVCSIIIANGDNIILLEFDPLLTPSGMNELFLIGNQNNKIVSSSSLKKLKNNDKFMQFNSFSLKNYSIDYNEYSVIVVKNRICFVSQKQLILTNINKGVNYYIYKLKDEDNFIDFFKYEGIQHFFVYSKNKVLRFRYIFRFHYIDNILKHLKEIQTKYSKDNVEFNISKFNFDYYDNQTFSKCNYIIDAYRKELVPMKYRCYNCNLKAQFMCSLCQEYYYCSKEHQIYEWSQFHFFECNMLQLFKDVLKNEIKGCTRYFLLIFQKYYGKILKEIFILSKDKIDLQMNLISLNYMIDFLERFDLIIYKNIFNDLIKTFQTENLDKAILWLDKSIMLDTISYYYSIRLLYSKFCIETDNIHVGYNNLNYLLNFMKFIKPDYLFKSSMSSTTKIEDNSFKNTKKSIFMFLYDSTYDRKNSDIISNFIKNQKHYDRYINNNYFKYLTLFKSTIIKFYLKLEIKNEDFMEYFIDDTITFYEYYYNNDPFIQNHLSFYLSFFYIEEFNLKTAIALLKKITGPAEDKILEENSQELKIVSHYNLGMLEYALGNSLEGINQLEEANRLNKVKKSSIQFLLQIQEHLALAYLDQNNLRTAYSLLQQSINMRSLRYDDKNMHESIRLNFYINFIIDFIEYQFVEHKKHIIWNQTSHIIEENDFEKSSKTMTQYSMKYLDVDNHENELYSEETVKINRFIYELTKSEISLLNEDNLLNGSKNHKDQFENSFAHKDLNKKEFKNEIELKKNFVNNISASKQEILRSLNLNLLKRKIILRDVLGPINHYNLNYHPIYSKAFQKIIDMIRSNFLIQEFSRTEKLSSKFKLKYNANSILSALGKYMKTQDMNYAVIEEKIRIINKGKLDKNDSQHLNTSVLESSRSRQQNNSVKMDFPTFQRRMLENFEIKDLPESFTELIWPSFNYLSDEEINLLLEIPEKFLLFIKNDTKVFNLNDESKRINNRKIKN